MVVANELKLCSGGLIHATLGEESRRWLMLLPAALCWLPIALLVVASGNETAIGGFFRDLVVHVRFLFALPLLAFAEGPVARKTGATTSYLLHSKLIAPEVRERLDLSIGRLNAIERVVWLDFALIALLITLSFIQEPLGSGRYWQAEAVPADEWMRHMAIPYFQLTLIRWAIRLGLWSWLLLLLSRAEIVILAHHPDGAGGLAVLRPAHLTFSWVVLATSAVYAANMHHGIATRNLPLDVLYEPMIQFGFVTFALFLSPLLLFTPRLVLKKGTSVLELSRFSSLCSRVFQSKWIEGSSTPSGIRSPLDTSEISSMTDLTSIHQHAQQMKIVVLNKNVLQVFAAAALAPFGIIYGFELGWQAVASVALKVFT